MVRPERQRRVVERPVLLLDDDRLAAHLEDQRLTERLQLFEGGDREAGVAQPVEVDRRPR